MRASLGWADAQLAGSMLGNDQRNVRGRFGEKLLFMNKLAEGVGLKWTGKSIKETRQFERSAKCRGSHENRCGRRGLGEAGLRGTRHARM